MKPALMLLFAAVPAHAQDDPSTVSGPLPPVSQDVFQDADAPIDVAPAPRFPLAQQQDASGPENVLSEPRVRERRNKQEGGAAPQLSSRLSIRDLMQEVLVDRDEHGRVWARGRDYRASFGQEGFTFLPVVGKRAPREFPLAFSLEQVTVGGETLALGSRAVEREGSTVTIDRDGLDEVYHLDLEQVEQTFVFDSLPASGELVVRIAVDSELQATEDGTGIHFAHPEYGQATYGDAFAFDATGERIPVERVWLAGRIELRVPAEFVAGAVLPLTIDPPVTFFSSSFGAEDDHLPDITFDGRSNLYWVVWQEYTSSANRDCYATYFDTAGGQGPGIAIEATNDSWTAPRIAYHYGADRLLVVANEVQESTGWGAIQGRFINAATNTVLGAEFSISSIGVDKRYADVGGNNWDSTTNAHFCVTWSAEWAAGDHDVQYRIVDWDGTFVTNITSVDTSTANDVQVAISESHGDAELLGDWWTIAWMRDTNADGLGTIMARRVVWSGNTGLGAGNFVVDSNTNCSYPTVTSRLDRNLIADGDRPSIVAYQRRFSTVSGTPPYQYSIYARVVGDGITYASNSVNYVLEDIDEELDQRFPSIATDGDAFFLVYGEVYWGNPAGSDYDMYMLSGHVSETTTNAYLALAERHQNMAFNQEQELYGRVCTVWDGESVSSSDDAAAIWVQVHDSTGGLLEGAFLDAPTTDVSSIIAVGRQYCDANANSKSSTYSSWVSSWTWMDGDQSLNTTHRVYCVDVPNNQFGYLLAGKSTTNVDKPGGSQGRLCVGGAGRYTNAIQNSGSSGTFVTNVNPHNIPQPSGPVSAQPGETWYFQYWHRDVGNNSNFSSAVAVTFEP